MRLPIDLCAFPQLNDLLVLSPFEFDSVSYCLKMSTNYTLPERTMHSETEVMPKYLHCSLVEQCVKLDEWCDNVNNCADEQDCFSFEVENQRLIAYLLSRTNRQSHFYNSNGDDFAWQTASTGDFDDSFLLFNASASWAPFSLHAFGLNERYGLSLLEQKVGVSFVWFELFQRQVF